MWKLPYEGGWAELLNGKLIMHAESDGFDLLITSDQGIPDQHNWTGRSLALLVLSTNDWNSIRRSQDRILAAVNAIQPSECDNFDVPRGE